MREATNLPGAVDLDAVRGDPHYRRFRAAIRAIARDAVHRAEAQQAGEEPLGQVAEQAARDVADVA